MKKLRSIVALVLTVATVFAFAACNKSDKTDNSHEKTEHEAANPVQAMSMNYAGYLKDTFGVSEDNINSFDPSEFPNAHAFEGEYYICTDGTMPDMEFSIYDNPSEAREYFEGLCDRFNAGFNEERFDGDYRINLDDDSGYIVINGIDSGVNIFGDYYAVGNTIYAGIYYNENTVLIIRPRNDLTPDDIEEIISTMGLPMANGENT